MKLNNVIFIAGLGFFMLSFFIMGILPWIQGADIEPAQYLTEYNEFEKRGREIYIREVCWHCHTQFVRPVGGESERYGPVSQVGEYVYDKPHLFGTRRVGPDLAREGGKRPDGWHVAHLKDPQALVSVSVMPKYTWLKDDEIVALVAYLQKLGTGIGDWRGTEPAKAEGERGPGKAPVKPSAELMARGKHVYFETCIVCHGLKGDGRGPAAASLSIRPADFTDEVWKHGGTDQEVFNTITRGVTGTGMEAYGGRFSEHDRWGLVMFVKSFARGMAKKGGSPLKPSPELRARGLKMFNRLCVGCHGLKGDGKGPVAAALLPRPADFTDEVWKHGGTDQEIFNTITRGVAGTAMAPFGSQLSERDRWALVMLVKSFVRVKDAPDPESVEPVKALPDKEREPIGALIKPSPELLDKGKHIYYQICTGCHGVKGDGKGPVSAMLTPKPADFTDDIWKHGESHREIFNIIAKGVQGTAMPPFSAQFSEHDRWAVLFFIRTFSAR